MSIVAKGLKLLEVIRQQETRRQGLTVRIDQLSLYINDMVFEMNALDEEVADLRDQVFNLEPSGATSRRLSTPNSPLELLIPSEDGSPIETQIWTGPQPQINRLDTDGIPLPKGDTSSGLNIVPFRGVAGLVRQLAKFAVDMKIYREVGTEGFDLQPYLETINKKNMIRDMVISEASVYLTAANEGMIHLQERDHNYNWKFEVKTGIVTMTPQK
jgi:hypothetical protein